MQNLTKALRAFLSIGFLVSTPVIFADTHPNCIKFINNTDNPIMYKYGNSEITSRGIGPIKAGHSFSNSSPFGTYMIIAYPTSKSASYHICAFTVDANKKLTLTAASLSTLSSCTVSNTDLTKGCATITVNKKS